MNFILKYAGGHKLLINKLKRVVAFTGFNMLLLLCVVKTDAQKDWNNIDRQGMISLDTFFRKDYTLEFFNKDEFLNDSLKQRLVETFFKVYPEEADEYNKETTKKVVFFMDPGYKGVAATSGNIVRFNPQWFHNHPGDIDVVTHEVMHIVQSYPGNAGPGWLTEGIADYVRYTLGVDNAGAHWSLPDFSPKQHYENAYRITARFLAWLEKNKLQGIVRQLDAAMRTKKYDPGIWKKLTGKSVDELWRDYAENPAI
ncbi:MAG: basic secretory protein-like protein [Ferruginibacter sp.]